MFLYEMTATQFHSRVFRKIERKYKMLGRYVYEKKVLSSNVCASDSSLRFVNLSLIAGFNRLFVENVYADEGVEFPVSSNKVYVTLKNIKTGVPSDTIALKIGIINLNKAININLNDIKLRYYFTNDGCSLYRLI